MNEASAKAEGAYAGTLTGSASSAFQLLAWWLGHSLGGIVALQLAARHPQAVAGLVLLGANAREGRHSGEARRSPQWALAQQHGLKALAYSKLAPGYGLSEGDALLASLGAQAEAVGLQRFAHQLAYQRQRPGLLEPGAR